jgi:hypothetical protein
MAASEAVVWLDTIVLAGNGLMYSLVLSKWCALGYGDSSSYVDDMRGRYAGKRTASAVTQSWCVDQDTAGGPIDPCAFNSPPQTPCSHRAQPISYVPQTCILIMRDLPQQQPSGMTHMAVTSV